MPKKDEVERSPNSPQTGYQKVAQVFVVKTNTILTIKTQTETIETTKPHPFYVIGKGFVAAKDLQVGDHLKMANGEEAIIESLTLTHHDDPITVYNFEVENWHTYHVAGSEVLVHNISKNACGVGGDASDAVDSLMDNAKRETPDQKALRDLAKEAEKAAKKGNPISEKEAKILDGWADEYSVPQHHQTYSGSGSHFPGGNYSDHTHIYNIHVPYKTN